MNIEFKRKYPCFSKVPEIVEMLKTNGLQDYPLLFLRNIFLPLHIFECKHLVYCGVFQGDTLRLLVPFLERIQAKVTLIENYAHLQNDTDIAYTKKCLYPRINEARSRINNFSFIEKDFYDVWPTLKNVDVLLLDGPNFVDDFNPFAKDFTYIMHDINYRESCGDDIPFKLLKHLCYDSDKKLYELFPTFDVLSEKEKNYFEGMENNKINYWGSYGWLCGSKIEKDT